MTPRIAIVGLAITLTLGACSRADPLSVQDQPGGDAVLLHVLTGPDSQAICIRTSLSDGCDNETADVLITDFADIDDVHAEWIDDRNVQVTVASGKVVRARPSSADGRFSIALVGS